MIPAEWAAQIYSSVAYCCRLADEAVLHECQNVVDDAIHYLDSALGLHVFC